MQRFPCPFCGLRDEREFHYLAEPGKVRPSPRAEVSEETWAAYLYDVTNAKGRVREVWLHLPCAEMVVMERDSMTMEVMGVTALRGAP
jgi:sarcosine oxidase subunit delta